MGKVLDGRGGGVRREGLGKCKFFFLGSMDKELRGGRRIKLGIFRKKRIL